MIVITGGGQLAFIAGADLGTFGEIFKGQDFDRAKAFMELGHSTLSKIENSNKPVIAAINGVCLGGGLELAMACHMRICGDRVRLGQPEINLGIIPGWGGTQRLQRIVGPAKATEMILTGEQITAQQAMQSAAGQHGGTRRRSDAPGQRSGGQDRQQERGGHGLGADRYSRGPGCVPAGRPGGRARTVRQVVTSDDAREGIMAFLEKREAKFQDK